MRIWSADNAEEFGLEPGPVLQPVGEGVVPGQPRQAIASTNMKVWLVESKSNNLMQAFVKLDMKVRHLWETIFPFNV